jgi:hypothetical protein
MQVKRFGFVVFWKMALVPSGFDADRRVAEERSNELWSAFY